MNQKPQSETVFVHIKDEPVKVAYFACPHCSAGVRVPDVRNSAFAPLLAPKDMEVPCPACKVPLKLRTAMLIHPAKQPPTAGGRKV